LGPEFYTKKNAQKTVDEIDTLKLSLSSKGHSKCRTSSVRKPDVISIRVKSEEITNTLGGNNAVLCGDKHE